MITLTSHFRGGSVNPWLKQGWRKLLSPSAVGGQQWPQTLYKATPFPDHSTEQEQEQAGRPLFPASREYSPTAHREFQASPHHRVSLWCPHSMYGEHLVRGEWLPLIFELFLLSVEGSTTLPRDPNTRRCVSSPSPHHISTHYQTPCNACKAQPSLTWRQSLLSSFCPHHLQPSFNIEGMGFS